MRRLNGYRKIVKALGRIFFGRRLQLDAREVPVGDADFWFHAASAGELEGILPVVENILNHRKKAVVTVFSLSGAPGLKKWQESLEPWQREQVLYAGLSPMEGDWEGALKRLVPKLFVSVKYEAWPELWASLSRAGIPLFVVGARARASLRFARWFVPLLGEKLPSLRLWAFDESEEAPLKRLFAAAAVRSGADPRWDRIASRLERKSARVAELIRKHRHAPRPWGVLGSVWPRDLERLKGSLSNSAGTLWVVPHKVDPESLREVRAALERHPPAVCDRAILITEMGVLLELYEHADWAFVGGGFAHGLHSTMEPALAGVPIVGGPKNAWRFAEVRFLERSGQLQLIARAADFTRWWENHAESIATGRQKAKIRAQLKGKLGGAKSVASALLDAINSPS